MRRSAALVKRNSRRATVGMAELLVSAALSYLHKAQSLQSRNDLLRLQYRQLRHDQETCTL